MWWLRRKLKAYLFKNRKKKQNQVSVGLTENEKTVFIDDPITGE